MPFGRHWEWRGFGDVREEFRTLITSHPLYFQTESPITDVYLWTRRAQVNVKLRGDALKFKRFVARKGEFECWLEDEAEMFPFPLSAQVVSLLGEALGVALPAITIPQADDLRAWLDEVAPTVRVVRVLKQRQLHFWPVSDAEPAIVELTEVLAPETITTFALEHPQLPALRSALTAFTLLRQTLRPFSYFQALARWAQGQWVSAETNQG